MTNQEKVPGARGYEEATEQESSSSGSFLLLGCNGFLGTSGGCSQSDRSS